MSTSTVSTTLLAATFLAAIYGCSSEAENPNSGNYTTGAGAATGAGATGGTGAGATGGATGTGGTAGSADTGAGGTTGGATGAGGTAGTAGTGGTGGGAGDITAVKPSPGCNMDPGQALGAWASYTIQTSGVKDADSTSTKDNGPWTYERNYAIWLPPTYVNTKAYPLILQGPGCGGGATNQYSLSPTNNDQGHGVGGQVIRVGFAPKGDIGHVIMNGCFDDKEGDDSIEFAFYEGVIDTIKTKLCYDENRVFISGNSSGAWWGNELGCVYAGTTDGYAIRGVAVNTGGLPPEPQYRPTCSTAPMAGMWVHEINDGTNPFEGNKEAIKRAMAVNGCTMGTDFDSATLVDYPIGNNRPDATCKKIQGCPDNYPLVVCPLPGSGHGGHEDTANPGFATFFTSFFAP